VVDQLRVYLNRPLREGDRPKLFALAVAVIAAGVAVLSLLDDAGPSQRRPEPTPAPSPVATASVTPGPAANPEPSPDAAPSEEGVPEAQASPAQIRAVKHAARTFLAGYLAYSYGQGKARRIRGAAPDLRKQLAAQPPVVPPSERRREPKVRLIQTEGVSPQAATLQALVADGARSYSVSLGLQRRAGGRWVVTTVES
jgi:hypothetical protein